MDEFNFDWDAIYPDEECIGCGYLRHIPEVHRGVMDGDPEEWSCRCGDLKVRCWKFQAEYDKQYERYLEAQEDD